MFEQSGKKNFRRNQKWRDKAAGWEVDDLWNKWHDNNIELNVKFRFNIAVLS